MGNSGWTADPDDIMTPPDASPGDVFIYIGPNDPIASALFNDAAIMFYFGLLRAFGIAVNRVGSSDIGTLDFFAFDSVLGSYALIEMRMDVPLQLATVSIGQGGIGKDVNTIISGKDILIFPDGVGTQLRLGIASQADREDTDLVLYGTSAARGFITDGSATVNSGGNIAEAVVLTTDSVTFIAGRAYRVTTSGGCTNSVANSLVLARVRKTNVAGQLIGEFSRYPLPAAATSYGVHGTTEFVIGATSVTAALVLTFTGGGGGTVVHTIGVAGLARTLVVEDIGAAADYPNRPALV